MEAYLYINQNLKDLLDIISPISVIITAWIAFTVYIFNYTMKSYFGKLEIKNDASDKLIPMLVGVMFLFGAVAGAGCAYSIKKSEIVYAEAIHCLIILLFVLLFFYLSNLNKILKFIKTGKKLYLCIYIVNMIVGFFLGGLVILIIKNRPDKYNIFLGITSFIWGYYIILMMSGKIFYKFVSNTLKLYKVECENENIEGYLIGVFNDFFEIKDKDNNIKFINKDEIKEIREIKKLSVNKGKETNKSLKSDDSYESEENKENIYLVKVKKN